MTTRQPQPRQPRGVPSGGQYAETQRADADVTLELEPNTGHTIASALAAEGLKVLLVDTDRQLPDGVAGYDLTTLDGRGFVVDLDTDNGIVHVRSQDSATGATTFTWEGQYDGSAGLGTELRRAITAQGVEQANRQGVRSAVEVHGLAGDPGDFYLRRTEDGKSPQMVTVQAGETKAVAQFDDTRHVTRLTTPSGSELTADQRAALQERLGDSSVAPEVALRSFALAATHAAHIDEDRRLGRPVLQDRDFLAMLRGDFADGYTDDDIERCLPQVKGAELACVWEYRDEYGFGGDSQIVGRIDDGPWREISPELWEHLSDPDSNVDLSSISMLSDDVYDAGVAELDPVYWGGRNLALEEEKDDNDYDPDSAWQQLVNAGYDPDVARQVADSASDYDSAYERIVLAAGR